ncbi:MAG: hypothetical protein V8T51_08380 [Senegalimassilia faecalis]
MCGLAPMASMAALYSSSKSPRSMLVTMPPAVICAAHASAMACACSRVDAPGKLLYGLATRPLASLPRYGRAYHVPRASCLTSALTGRSRLAKLTACPAAVAAPSRHALCSAV